MDNSALNISPLDGRYHDVVDPLRENFSEYGYMKQRFVLELEYLEFFLKVVKDEIITFDKTFSIQSYYDVKKIEAQTNHDVKAIEYYIQTRIEAKYHNFIHFGLTSHDIDNVSLLLNIKHVNETVMNRYLCGMVDKIKEYAESWKHIAMLSHTHGQPATPTTVGKELNVFAYRLRKQICELQQIEYYAKFGGAVGNLNAHKSALPNFEWPELMKSFMTNLGLVRDEYTTQLSNYDDLSKMLGIYQRINTILIDMCQDIWLYIGMNYFKLNVITSEIGSSTMPHKINPIQFENAEGNLGMANCLIQHMQTKLPVSRLQRDLTDSTVSRNIGTIYGHMYQSYCSIMKGLNRITPDETVIMEDLNKNYVVIAEAIQTHLKLLPNMTNSYEKLKDFCRGSYNLTKNDFDTFIDSLDCDSETKDQLKSITPSNYIGYAMKTTNQNL